jgi:hypothetical protein
MDVAASVELKRKPSEMENGKWRNRIKQRICGKKKMSCRTAVARGLGFQGQTYETRLILRFFTYGF